MPPKLRKHEERVEELSGIEEAEYSVSSPMSVASSAPPAATVTMTNEQSQMMLRSVLSAAPTTGSVSVPPPPPPLPKVVKVEVPKLKDDEVPSEFFVKWEQAQVHNGMPRDAWCGVLPVYLTGRAQSCFSQIHPSKRMDCVLVKNELLKLLGDTPDSSDKKWWLLNRKGGETPGDLFQRVHSVGVRRMDGFETREVLLERMILSRYLSLLQPECYSHVAARRPKNGQEAALMVQEFEEDRSFAGKLRNRGFGGHPHHFKREGSQGFNKGSSGGSVNGNNEGSRAVTPPRKEGSISKDQSGEKSVKQEKWSKKERKPIVCYGCGEPGHIRPNCPEKIRRVRSPEASEVKGAIRAKEITAWLAGREVTARIDSGADLTLVHKDYIPEEAYVDSVVRIGDYDGGTVKIHSQARISIRVGTIEQTLCVVVTTGKSDYPALLGCDLCEKIQTYMCESLKVNAEKRLAEKRKNEKRVYEKMDGQVRVATRAQAAKQAALEQEDIVVSAQSDCAPVPLSEVFEFPDSYFEQDPTPTPAAELCTWPEEGVADLPLPEVHCSDTEKLGQEQKEDLTLKNEWQLALDGGKGYAFDRGVLVHYSKDELDEYVQRVVVPVGRRKQVLKIAHSNITAGHFGVKKTFAKIKLHFQWPKMLSDVREYVRICGGCQRAAPGDGGRAPLQPLPCISEPFSTVAFDIVGPLPITTSGYRYIHTFMCLFTKFPEAIPLRKVDNLTVCNAMMDVFSRYGLPKVLLSDQGSVFTSQLTRQLCKTFEISKVQTSPYHPQSDGALERWHACLKGMVKRAGVNIKDWDLNLRYLLFAYRDTPHCVTGYSPFTLMYGREVNGPLQFLRDSWLEGRSEEVKVDEWLEVAKARMVEAAGIVSDREKKAKTKMKEFYDRKAVLKTYYPGDMVLVKKPILRGKLLKAWEGPYEIEKKVSPITYLVRVKGNGKKSKVLHCNLCITTVHI